MWAREQIKRYITLLKVSYQWLLKQVDRLENLTDCELEAEESGNSQFAPYGGLLAWFNLMIRAMGYLSTTKLGMTSSEKEESADLTDLYVKSLVKPDGELLGKLIHKEFLTPPLGFRYPQEHGSKVWIGTNDFEVKLDFTHYDDTEFDQWLNNKDPLHGPLNSAIITKMGLLPLAENAIGESVQAADNVEKVAAVFENLGSTYEGDDK